MNPILDQLIVGLLIVGSLGFFARRAFGKSKKGGCSSGCCSGSKGAAGKFSVKP